MSIGEVSHCAPIHKHHLNSLNINVTIHLIQQMGSKIWVKFWVKSDIFFKITCVSFTSIICNSYTY